MWHLAGILSIVGVLLAAGGASAATPPAPPVPLFQPFVKVTVPEGPINLGYVGVSGCFQSDAKANLRVLANCPYQIMASLRELKHKSRVAALSPEQTLVMINGKQTTLGGRVLIAKSQAPTPAGGEEIPVTLQVGVKNLMQCPAGQYAGTLVITVMATP
ncbi:MAG: hypothetical protein A2Y76_12500 [Planctomycetes bacterium RBG_13_60_9]|nr:MAG: hypothetical protein A2Y76_12500 [Planctomycetes bacterium RBG_13_60_9]